MDKETLIVTGVDGTLLNDEAALERFQQWIQDQGPGLKLVYVTGRFIESIVEIIEHTALPRPVAIIGGVGTEIQMYPSQEPLKGWPKSCSGRWDAQRVRRVLAEWPALLPQSEESQSPYKISYHVEGVSERFLSELRQSLEEHELDAELVYSSGRELDVLPAGINKGTAVEHLLQHWQLEPSQVIFCADSRNDLSLFDRGFRGVVVANAQEDMKRTDDSNIHVCQANHASGVIEGLCHWLGLPE